MAFTDSPGGLYVGDNFSGPRTSTRSGGRINWRRVGRRLRLGLVHPGHDCRGDTSDSLGARTTGGSILVPQREEFELPCSRWCLSYYVDRRASELSDSPASKVQMDESRERDHDQGGDEVNRLANVAALATGVLLRVPVAPVVTTVRFFGKVRAIPRRRQQRGTLARQRTHVFNAHSAIRFDDQRARAIVMGTVK